MNESVQTPAPQLEERAALAAVRARLLGRGEPTSLTRYRLLHPIGEGGYGTVFIAYDPELERQVAIKIVRARVDAAEMRARFRREARLLAGLGQPNIVQVYDLGVVLDDDGREQVFIVMELLRGRTLRQWLRETSPAPARIVEVFLAAGEGLAAAHAAGVVHRDFKPDNVIVTDDGRVKVLDFGLARAVADAEGESAETPAPGASASNEHAASAGEGSLTGDGRVVGTPRYMAPEQHDGLAATSASDRFALCASLYEALAGALPFAGSSIHELIRAKASHAIRPPLRGRKIGARLRRVLARGMDPDPRQRYPDTDALLVAIRGAAAPRRVRTLLLGVAGLAVVAAVAWNDRASSPCDEAGELAAAWSTERREAAREGLAATGSQAAEPVWNEVDAALGEHVDRWSAQRSEACRGHAEGTVDARAFDLGMRCNARRAIALGAMLDLFAVADRSTLSRAVGSARALDSQTSCEDGIATARGGADADALRDELAQISVGIGGVPEPERLVTAEATVAVARDLDDDELLAEALFVSGALHRDAGSYALACERLDEALWRAELVGRPRLAARIVPHLIYARQRHGQYDPDQLESLEAVLARADVPIYSGMARVAIGGLYIARGEFERAEQELLRARAILEDGGEVGSLAYAESMTGLASIYGRAGRFDEAQALIENAIEHLQAAGGPYAPGLAYAHERLGSIHHRRKDLEAAAAQYRRSAELFEVVFGATHPDAAWPRFALAMVSYEQGRLDEALREGESALAALGSDGPPDDMRGTMFANLSIIQNKRGEHEAALRYAEQALAVFTATRGPQSEDVASALRQIGEIQVARGRGGEAETALRRAEELFAALDAKDDVEKTRELLAKATSG